MIRPAEQADAESIARVHVSAWISAYRGILSDAVLDGLDVVQKTKDWSAKLSADDCQTFVSVRDGVVRAWLNYGSSRDKDCPEYDEVRGMYVDPSEWRGGHGSALMKQAEQVGKRAGKEALIVWTLKLNERGRAFYESCGYALDGVRKTIYVGGLPLQELRYLKELS